MGIDAYSAEETEANKVCEPVVDFPKHSVFLKMVSSSLDSSLVPSSFEDVMCTHTRPVLGTCRLLCSYLHATRLVSLWLSFPLVKGAVVVLNLLRV